MLVNPDKHLTSEKLKVLEPAKQILHDLGHVGLEGLNFRGVGLLELGNQPVNITSARN